jgi:hypothetical protein
MDCPQAKSASNTAASATAMPIAGLEVRLKKLIVVLREKC